MLQASASDMFFLGHLITLSVAPYELVARKPLLPNR